MSENRAVTQAETTPLRRQPVQQRSAKRVERMLDASAELLDEVGYEGLTTTLIAKRAGVAVGSLYQFFPDKRAVVQALTHRNLERFVTAVNERLGTLDASNWWDIVDSLLDIYLVMHREVPGFSKVHFGDVVDPQLLDERRTNNRVIVDALAELISAQVRLSKEEIVLPISIAVEAADGLLDHAFRIDPHGDPTVIDEAKTMIKCYLAERFGE
ncbi:TetR family transcriptional regulator [Saccharomonospora xinjiangensis]|uniref:TetR family transcriptional regulator n=1 Tax=Saccharomonospora xinjiangensis TaxID=75294 RepID=UPI00106F8738|nr:TetR family transcriptional regulator [Saccharomonospora xinjiangensis]QBQ58454.1 Tetracycline repressor protein class B [Saccharomonospora xinjiangensis]